MSRRLLTLILAASSPAVLLADLLLRALLGARLAPVVELCAAAATRAAWIALPATAVLLVPGALLARRRRGLPGLVLGACLVQAPALAAGAAGVLGAALLPVGLTAAAATLGVLLIGLW